MIADDYLFCRDIIKRHSTSFYRAFRHLSRDKANAVYAIYAFCRTADDIADVENSAETLREFEAKWERFQAGDTPDEPLWRALRDVFARFPMETGPFDDMLEGQRTELALRRIETADELDRYCYLVAGTVGLMLLPVIAARRGEVERQAAVSLGIAMQYTNILRDVGEDARRGKIYLPAALMAEYGVTERELKTGERTPAFVALWEHLAHKAEEGYTAAEQNLSMYEPGSRLAIRLSMAYYSAILKEIRKKDYPVLTSRVALPNSKKLLLFARYKLFTITERG